MHNGFAIIKFMKTAKNLKGFTLIEMLIYIAIFAIVAGLLIGILSTVTRVQNRETAAAEITQQLEFVMQNIQRYVRESSNIDIPAGIATSTLKLRVNNSSTDPILIFANASNTAIYIQQGTGASTTLTSNRVTVGNFSVTKYENPSGHATIQLDMTLNYNSTNAPLFTNVSRSLSTAIARVSAATFDSDLIPNADNTFSVGQTLNRWKNGFFDKIAIGTTTITNLFQIATTTPILTVVNTGNIGIGTTGPAGQLSLGSNSYQTVLTTSQAEGLAGADFRIGVDETNRTVIIADRGDIGTDFGLTAQANPSLYLYSAVPVQGYAKISTINGDTFSIDASLLGNINLITHSSYDFNVNSGKLVVKGTSGNVGIGTSTPQSALQVVGNYIQIPTISGANPAATDCDAAVEAGRMAIRTDGATSTTLWVCKGAGGWQGL